MRTTLFIINLKFRPAAKPPFNVDDGDLGHRIRKCFFLNIEGRVCKQHSSTWKGAPKFQINYERTWSQLNTRLGTTPAHEHPCGPLPPLCGALCATLSAINCPNSQPNSWRRCELQVATRGAALRHELSFTFSDTSAQGLHFRSGCPREVPQTML